MRIIFVLLLSTISLSSCVFEEKVTEAGEEMCDCLKDYNADNVQSKVLCASNIQMTAAEDGVTIGEIERKVGELCPDNSAALSDILKLSDSK